MPMKFHPVKTVMAGRAYNAWYELGGGRVSVSSAYGSKAAELGDKDAETEAKRLLDEIIRGTQ